MNWWVLLPLAVIPLGALGAWVERRFPEEPQYAPHGEPGRTIPFCACSRGSQRLGMRW